MNTVILNNASACEFFANTCLDVSKPPGVFATFLHKIGLFKSSKDNLFFYSDSQFLDDFAFALAAAVALSGRYCAFVAPVVKDYRLEQFEPLPEANHKSFKDELNYIKEHLLLVRSDACLPNGVDFAVICPYGSYFHELYVPHAYIDYSRTQLEGYKLVHFKILPESFVLSTFNAQMQYYFSPPTKLSFAKNEETISEQTAQLLINQNLAARTNTSRLRELNALLSVRDIDNLSLSIQPPCSIGLRLHGTLVPVDFSALQAKVDVDFKILKEPSF